MKKLLLLSILVLFIFACKQKKKPFPQICPAKTSYKYLDTIAVNNCSENYTKVRWVLPDGTPSTDANTVYFIPPSPGNYTFTIYASNNNYVTEFETSRTIIVNP